jgi:hypothetical protein
LSTTGRAAGYVNDRQGWLAMPPESRAGYILGINDSANLVYLDDSLVTAVGKKGRTRCLQQQKTTAAILADRITMAYREDRFASMSPSIVYILKMNQVCKTYIDAERAQFGLGPS